MIQIGNRDIIDIISLIVLVIAIFIFSLICIDRFSSLHKKDTKKTIKPKPVDRQTITSTEITGNAESIHPWGRTEIVPMKSIKLVEYDEWVMYGYVVQPVGRKGYFMPVMRGNLNLNVKDLTQTWVEHEKLGSGSIENPETFEDFRVADIRVKEGKIIDINYFHYRLLPDHTWNIIASWKAIVNSDAPEKIKESNDELNN